MSTGRELADEDPSDPPSITTKDAAIGFADNLSDSTAATSSSRPSSTTKYFVADFAEDPSKDDLVGQEKFLLSVEDYFPNLILRRHFLPQVLQNHHRISVSWHDLNLKDSIHSSCTTSIICIPQRGYRPKGSVENFASLKVLHVLRRDDRSYWELGQVFELINLTYLASNIPDSIVPPAIAKLQNLQTLIIYRFDVCLPVESWNLSAGYYLDNLVRLLRLEKLKLEAHGSFVRHFDILGFPQSLIKLELNGGWISWNDMTIVGSLPNLQVLKLKNYACYGDQWETIQGEFGRLILLLIDESNLKCWRTSSSHFPSLKCLMLHRCAYLDEIPNDIGDIPALELIEIDDHNQSLWYSAEKIQEEVWEKYGIGDLKVVAPQDQQGGTAFHICESERVEVVVEECLEELIKQSLVLISSQKSDGKIKSCRLHRMVRDFCVRQAGQEKFLLSVTDYFPTRILRRHFLPQVLQNHHRILRRHFVLYPFLKE
ncbi:hypothetical protein SASPL_106321 [Salvia splendens]|uniref:Uncharacterized protein n=1 Tax=Salvia splendens TaxID=180675 RepID=A0A8X9ABM0_SALSN|nr:hypothetical protein SASPL_106321 [Salvia splendens]